MDFCDVVSSQNFFLFIRCDNLIFLTFYVLNNETGHIVINHDFDFEWC